MVIVDVLRMSDTMGTTLETLKLLFFIYSIELQPLPSAIELQPQPFANCNPQSAPEIAIHNPQLTAMTSHREQLPQPSRDSEIELF